MILELHTSAVSCFGIKVVTLYLFRKSEKGDNMKLSRTGFRYKQKR